MTQKEAIKSINATTLLGFKNIVDSVENEWGNFSVSDCEDSMGWINASIERKTDALSTVRRKLRKIKDWDDISVSLICGNVWLFARPTKSDASKQVSITVFLEDSKNA